MSVVVLTMPAFLTYDFGVTNCLSRRAGPTFS
jgi:hypothetical protein